MKISQKIDSSSTYICLELVLAPLHELDQLDKQDTWISTPDSIRLHPPPTAEGQLGTFPIKFLPFCDN